MSDTVISIENLSKRYLIGHQSAQRHRYLVLRDVIAREVNNFARKAADLVVGRQIIQGDEVEEFWALRDVSFEVKRGEVIGILGRNGAGKSTLLKILSRITEPTEGRVLLHGRVASLLEVGTGFHPELSGRENIFLNGVILGMSRREIRHKFDEIVAFAEVEQFLDTPAKRYSSGMYVRLAFAVAAHLDAEILLIDEVLAVGDMEFQRKCIGKMSEVAHSGRTILFVSHNHEAIRRLCSHAVVMRAGQAGQKCGVDTALESYSSEIEKAINTSWSRPDSYANAPVRFESIDLTLEGSQPDLRLLCQLSISADKNARACLIQAFILDQGSTMIVQVEPKTYPFAGGAQGMQRFDLTIELPPLVPGSYGLEFWLGPHYTNTYDHVRGELGFLITDPPSPGRTYPFRPNRGSIVAKSSVRICKE